MGVTATRRASPRGERRHGIVNALDGGMAGGAGVVHGVAGLGGRCLGRAQLGCQVGIGLGNRGDRGAVELFLRGLGQKVDGY